MSRNFLSGMGASMASSSVIWLLTTQQLAMLVTLFLGLAIVGYAEKVEE